MRTGDDPDRVPRTYELRAEQRNTDQRDRRLVVTYILRFFPALLILVACMTWGHAPAVARGAPESFADLAEKLLPSVVNI
jgi:serine protease Do